jgi:hypothetical protein
MTSFSSQKNLENLNIPENNIICVKAAKVLWYKDFLMYVFLVFVFLTFNYQTFNLCNSSLQQDFLMFQQKIQHVALFSFPTSQHNMTLTKSQGCNVVQF